MQQAYLNIVNISAYKKLNSRELYNMQLILNVETPTAQTYFKKIFQNPELNWKTLTCKN